MIEILADKSGVTHWFVSPAALYQNPLCRKATETVLTKWTKETVPTCLWCAMRILR